MTALRRATKAFGRFWLDFLVGDTPEIFVGVLVIVGGALLLRHHRAVGIPVVVALTVILFVSSTLRGQLRRRARQRVDAPS